MTLRDKVISTAKTLADRCHSVPDYRGSAVLSGSGCSTSRPATEGYSNVKSSNNNNNKDNKDNKNNMPCLKNIRANIKKNKKHNRKNDDDDDDDNNDTST